MLYDGVFLGPRGWLMARRVAWVAGLCSLSTTAVAQDLSVVGTCPGTIEVTVTGSTEGSPIAIVTGEPGGTDTISELSCVTIPVDVGDAVIRGRGKADAAGELIRTTEVGVFACGRAIQGIDMASCATSPVLQIPECVATDDDLDGFDTCNGDCDDSDATVNPDAVEVYGDGVDQDCAGESIFFYPVDVPQELVVPDGVTSIDVRMWGAGGGMCGGVRVAEEVGLGGGGGYSDGELPVTPGEILSITVGGAGQRPVAGFGGAGGFGGGGPGGDANVKDPAVDDGGCGGGGASEVVGTGGAITAGGGGGAGWGTVTGTSGAGGGPEGGTPSQLTAGYGDGSGGGGGYGGASGLGGAGGVGHTNHAYGTGNGEPGTVNTGGAGGSDLMSPRSRGGGGGGGGYGGGGGGGASESWSAGAGGGGGGRTVADGTTITGDGTTPANPDDPDRGQAGEPGHGGRVILTLPD